MKAARVYAERLGWKVLPLETGGKRPLLKDWPNEASADLEVIEAWLEQWPTANVGLLTGDQFDVLDVDPRNGGLETLAALEAEHGPLPKTVMSKTGGGGFHYLFKPTGRGNGKLGPGLDFKGRGGQIVAPPSVTTGLYEWINPPWNTEIVDAPHWVARPPAPTERQIGRESPGERGWFPSATPAVIQQARETLDKHGPAVEGQGGDLHTFRAAALLIHDYALTADEAWPLFLDWNETCRPPWDEAGLRAKLDGGERYGKNPYGSARTLDAPETVRHLIRGREPNEAGTLELLRKCRLVTFTDPAQRETAERELVQATGFTKTAIALPKAKVPMQGAAGEGQILVTTRLAEMANESLGAMLDDVYQRNGVLCQVVTGQRTYIHDLDAASIQDLMSQRREYVRQDKEGLVTVIPPERVATILQSRRKHAEVRIIEAITNVPIFLADGSILETEGYNESARVYLEPSVSVFVPDEPTRDDARAAVALLEDVVCDFKFHSPADRSSWLAGILSPLVKAATKNAPSPLFCISASSWGAGKTLLAKLIALICTGADAENRPYNPNDQAEWAKKLTAFVKAASPISILDNANGAIGDDGLNRLITSSTWSDRILGGSDAPALPNVSTWFATGNNIEPVLDTVRRVLMVRIEVETERPQERTDFKRPLLEQYVLGNRAALLSAALTILRAYHVAQRPDMNLASWGSFTVWSSIVRAALVWAGCADPYLTQARVADYSNETENDAHDFWISVIESTDGTAAKISELANNRDVRTVLGTRESMTPLYVKRFLTRFIDKPRSSKRIRRAKKGDELIYRVEVIL